MHYTERCAPRRQPLRVLPDIVLPLQRRLQDSFPELYALKDSMHEESVARRGKEELLEQLIVIWQRAALKTSGIVGDIEPIESGMAERVQQLLASHGVPDDERLQSRTYALIDYARQLAEQQVAPPSQGPAL